MSLRLDRFVTLYLVQPCQRLIRGQSSGVARLVNHRRRLPILMYHSISADLQPGVLPYYQTVTTPGRFAEQMQLLKENGYRGLSLRDGLTWLRSGRDSINSVKEPGSNGALHSQPQSLNSSPVVLTFDDGFRDFHTNAYPFLFDIGFGATMFLPTAFIGNHGSRRQFVGRDCLNWEEVRDLNAAGVEFGSHTVNHPKLTEINRSQIKSEIVESRSEIEDQLGSAVTSFAYPYAYPSTRSDFAARLRNLLQAAGYQTCVTTRIGFNTANDDLLQLKRLPVNDGDDADFFEAKLDRAYDWMKGPQSLIKALTLKGHG